MTKTQLILLVAVTVFTLTAPLTLTLPAHGAVVYQIKQYVLHNITAGTVLAPHLYDWWIDGTGYIQLTSPKNVTILDNKMIIEWKWNVGTAWRTDLNPYALGVWLFYIGSNYAGKTGAYFPFTYGISDGLTWWIRNSTDYNFQKIFHILDGKWHKITLVFNGSLARLYRDDIYMDGYSSSSTIYYDKLQIQYRFFYIKGYASYLKVNTSNSILFLMDPSFFNGTTYFDLINDMVGVPYGGVSRVPANDTWVWVVEGAYNDSYIHFKWFPARTEVWVVNASGAEVAHVVVPANVTFGYGFNVSVGGGNYTVIINMPVPVVAEEPTQSATVGLGSFTYVVPNPSDVLNPSNFMGWWYGQLGDLALIIPLMIPATIYIKTRSTALTLESLILVSIGVMWLAPTAPILKIIVTAAGIALAVGIYRTIVNK